VLREEISKALESIATNSVETAYIGIDEEAEAFVKMCDATI